MGTDIYLRWDKQTKEETESQITGYAVDAGDKGYLRASIGMVKENTVLRKIFPDHWGGDEDSYDFVDEENQIKLQKSAIDYLMAVIFQIPMPQDDVVDQQLELGASVLKMLSGKGLEKTQMHTKSDLRFAVMWLNSLFEFYMLGLRKQKDGLNPKIYISW